MILLDLIYLLVLILTIPLWTGLFFKSRYRKILTSRFSPHLKASVSKRIWIHAVSVGEAKSISSLIELLKSQFKREVVLTVSTPSGYEFAKKEYPGIEVINSPVDFSWVIKGFIRRINPQILILNELEIWPNWISGCQKQNIPILLINGRISDNAYRKYTRFRWLLRSFFRKLDFTLVQAEIYQNRFINLGISRARIKIAGNIKADEALTMSEKAPQPAEVQKHLKMTLPEKKIITLASSHASDEKHLLPVIKRLQNRFAIIMVPRHPERIPDLINELKQQDIDFKLWSGAGSVKLDSEILIYDKIGYLFNILKISHLIIMGGTFEQKIGGHNLYEPAVLGKLILGGPYYNNFPDIGNELVRKKSYLLFHSGEELCSILEDIQKVDFEATAENGWTAVKKRKGSTQCILQKIQELIES